MCPQANTDTHFYFKFVVFINLKVFLRLRKKERWCEKETERQRLTERQRESVGEKTHLPVGFFSTTLLAPCRSACTYRSPIIHAMNTSVSADGT